MLKYSSHQVLILLFSKQRLGLLHLLLFFGLALSRGSSSSPEFDLKVLLNCNDLVEFAASLSRHFLRRSSSQLTRTLIYEIFWWLFVVCTFECEWSVMVAVKRR